MSQTVLARVNCIGITYVVGEIRDYHYEQIIEKILGVPEKEVEGIDDRGSSRFVFEVSTKERYEHICETFTGRDIVIGNNCRIQVDDISSYGTRVEISRVPFMVTNEMLSIMLQKYGKVYKCQNYYRAFGKYRNLNKSGDRIIWINLTKEIPQQLKINKTQMTINVYYNNQPISCNKCGHTGHKVRSCDQMPDAYINIIDVKEKDCKNSGKTGDNIDEEIEEDSGSDSDSDMDDDDAISIIDDNGDHNEKSPADIHIEPSQNKNIFECTKCDYICKYENILNVHMQTHTGENSIKCELCEIVSNDRSEHIKHMQTHTRDIILVCTESECTYQCLNKHVLSNHLQTHHKIFACEDCEYKSKSLQGLNGHVKIHKQKLLKCSKCEVTCTLLSDLNIHMKTHTGDERGPSSKRKELSVSPEMVDSNKKTKKKEAKKRKN